ncbi:unnamed protein product [Schistosoma margrebowiei]|uniref:beta-N-acetylhexosaminidase n=1 Tax=Schistosoma margrebowiei TaxID=48269 RepID=A0A183N9L2_9TREM|nr:unnamed protein product [Schistosoma margrebowiei]
METLTSEGKHGIQRTAQSQLDDLNFTDDLALPSHTHQQMQIRKTSVTKASPTGDKSTIIHVWKDLFWESVVKNVTKAGYRVLFSADWYLNYISYGDDWRYHYRVDPRDFGGSKDDAKLVIGGEAAMWGEYVDDTNLFSRS